MHRKLRGARIISLFTILALCLPCAAPALAAYEGPGWTTPEEAMTVYLEGIQEENLAKMLSAFAVETFVEKRNIEAYVRKNRYYSVKDFGYPSVNPVLRDLNVEKRKEQVIEQIIGHQTLLIRLAMRSEDPITFRSEDYQKEIDVFLAKLTEYSTVLNLKALRVIEFLDPATRIDPAYIERSQGFLKDWPELYGIDEFKSVMVSVVLDDLNSFAANFDLGSMSFILCCDMVRYGEKWFFKDLGGITGAFLDVPAGYFGVFPTDIRQ